MVVMTEMPQDHKLARMQRPLDSSWPSLGGQPIGHNNDDDKSNNNNARCKTVDTTGADDWGEFQDTDEGGAGPTKIPLKPNPKILHRSASTPDFGLNDDYSDSSTTASGSVSEADGDGRNAEEEEEEEEVRASLDEDSAVAVAVVGPTLPVVAPQPTAAAWGDATTPGSGGGGGGVVCGVVRRTPSFADMVKKAAAVSTADEENARAATAERLRTEREARRKARARHMKLVVTPIKRCSKSTGDLLSLGRIHELVELEDECNSGSGGGGGMFGGIAEQEEVLGETDAMEFYHRKAKGVQNRVSGKIIRPDEAKRKEISVYKRDLQRQKQQAAQGNKGKGGDKAAAKGGKGKGGKKR